MSGSDAAVPAANAVTRYRWRYRRGAPPLGEGARLPPGARPVAFERSDYERVGCGCTPLILQVAALGLFVPALFVLVDASAHPGAAPLTETLSKAAVWGFAWAVVARRLRTVTHLWGVSGARVWLDGEGGLHVDRYFLEWSRHAVVDLRAVDRLRVIYHTPDPDPQPEDPPYGPLVMGIELFGGGAMLARVFSDALPLPEAEFLAHIVRWSPSATVESGVEETREPAPLA